MFERWTLTDIVAALAGAAAVAYLSFEVSRRIRRLRGLYDVLDGTDAAVTRDLEQLVSMGRLDAFSGSLAA